MDRNTRIAIDNFAQSVRDAFDIADPKFDIKTFVYAIGGEIVESGESGPEGSVMATGLTCPAFRIILPFHHDIHRQRYTIAHELGHLFMHMGYMSENTRKWDYAKANADVYHRTGGSEEERQADEFAAAFLMPEKLYGGIIREYVDSNNVVNVKGLAEYFGVSEQAARIRGRNLGYISWPKL